MPMVPSAEARRTKLQAKLFKVYRNLENQAAAGVLASPQGT
jgi:hypothetical protein